ncbi:hypothetical protein [Shewanella spartinae]|uniref:hypothetical protein n=1 Tax=Shewanella spartinae TaxID=2864205 RepID=UPI001C65C68E|nr:hypothetical protein [Shewanella spartinae]QYJ92124.1 hypothetical protein K0I31_10665 [Shewanella spartinae]
MLKVKCLEHELLLTQARFGPDVKDDAEDENEVLALFDRQVVVTGGLAIFLNVILGLFTERTLSAVTR